MQKTILITGATDGIGLLTAQKLFSEGHQVLLHGRNEAKLFLAWQRGKYCILYRVLNQKILAPLFYFRVFVL